LIGLSFPLVRSNQEGYWKTSKDLELIAQDVRLLLSIAPGEVVMDMRLGNPAIEEIGALARLGFERAVAFLVKTVIERYEILTFLGVITRACYS